MRGLSNLFSPRSTPRFLSQASVVALLLVSCFLILISPQGTNSHEPITTKVRFNKEIIRIFQRHCLACHQSGSTTDISLATYATARPWAKAFKEEVLEKRMPPFQAVKGFGDFHNDYTLTQNEIDQIVSWVEGGAPKGDDKDLPIEMNRSAGWALGQPDLVLSPKWAGKSLEENIDGYKCVTIATNLKSSRRVSAVDFQSGDDSSVHCASFWIMQKSRGASVDCGRGNAKSEDSLGIWLPGQTPRRLPKNVGRLLPANANIVMRIHYHNNHDATPRSSLGLYFTRGFGIKDLRTMTLGTDEESILAGTERYRVKANYTMSETAEAISVRPLLYPFAKSVEVTAYKPDGSIEVLVWAQDYRYDWQPEYEFKKPVSLPKGTRIELVAYLDNSDNNPNNPNRPARTIRFTSPLCELAFVKSHGK